MKTIFDEFPHRRYHRPARWYFYRSYRPQFTDGQAFLRANLLREKVLRMGYGSRVADSIANFTRHGLISEDQFILEKRRLYFEQISLRRMG